MKEELQYKEAVVTKVNYTRASIERDMENMKVCQRLEWPKHECMAGGRGKFYCSSGTQLYALHTALLSPTAVLFRIPKPN